MLDSVHHINFVVRDLDAALPVWERVLGRPADSRDVLVGRGVDIARFRLGETWLVLVQPTGPGVPAEHLEKHGEGFFLLSLGVASLDDETNRLGAELLAGHARSGLDDWTVQDLDAEHTQNIQLQLTQTGGAGT